ncbi:MAG TPA: hypothetical protein ENK88_05380, partial [Campylobacterales bacterium]|nr:hypothetical protein [Campylobacterales bacterium]
MQTIQLGKAFIPVLLEVGGGIELSNRHYPPSTDTNLYYSYTNVIADVDSWFTLPAGEATTIFDDVYIMHKSLEWDILNVSYRNVQIDVGNLSNNFLDKATYDSNDDAIVESAKTVNGFTVESNVPPSAVFTDTTYAVGNNGLTEINFTQVLKDSYDNKEDGLGLPNADGQVLISSTDGTRQWETPNNLQGNKHFTDLLDTPSVYVANKSVKVNADGTALEYGDVTSVDMSFVALNDTPNSLVADKLVKVSSSGSSLEFTDIPAGTVLGLTDTPDTYIANKVLKVNANADGFTLGEVSGSFLNLDDTTTAYDAGKLVKVNPTGDGLIYGD